MTEQKTTFVLNGEWFDEFLSDSSHEEQAWFLRAIFIYNNTGEILSTEGQRDERYLRSHLKQMIRWFDVNNEKFRKRKIDNSLNQQIRWAKDDEKLIAELKRKKEFLKEHTYSEYTNVYGRIPTDSVYETDTVNDTDSFNENVSDSYSEYLSESESYTDSDSASDNDSVSDTKDKPLPLKFSADNLKTFENHLRKEGYPVEGFRSFILSRHGLGTEAYKLLKEYKNRFKPS